MSFSVKRQPFPTHPVPQIRQEGLRQSGSLYLHKVVEGGGKESARNVPWTRTTDLCYTSSLQPAIFSPSLLPKKPRSVISPLTPSLHSYPPSQAPQSHPPPHLGWKGGSGFSRRHKPGVPREPPWAGGCRARLAAAVEKQSLGLSWVSANFSLS